MPNIEERTEEIIKPIIQNLGYSIYDIQYVKEGKDYYLRIFIDSKNGIGLEDCEKVNNAITDILDEKDYIKESYFLEISSPGIERILRKEQHLKDNIGNKVSVSLFKQLDKSKQIIGTLEKFDNENIYVKDKDVLKIERKNISLIKTVYDWN